MRACGRVLALVVGECTSSHSALWCTSRQKLESADGEVGKLKEAQLKREESDQGLQGNAGGAV